MHLNERIGFSTLTAAEVNAIIAALKEAIARQTVDEVLAEDNHYMGALVKLGTFKTMGTGSIGMEAL